MCVSSLFTIFSIFLFGITLVQSIIILGFTYSVRALGVLFFFLCVAVVLFYNVYYRRKVWGGFSDYRWKGGWCAGCFLWFWLLYSTTSLYLCVTVEPGQKIIYWSKKKIKFTRCSAPYHSSFHVPKKIFYFIFCACLQPIVLSNFV